MRFKGFARDLDQDVSKRKEILDAALKEFGEVGYKEATIRSICKKARANVCLVSYYFGGKEGLYRAVYENQFNDYASNILKLIKVNDDVATAAEYEAQLKSYVAEIYSGMREKPDFVILMQRELVENASKNSGHPQKLIAHSQAHFTEYIKYGQKKKFVRKDLSPELCGYILMTTLCNFVQHEKTGHLKIMLPDHSPKDIPEQIIKAVTSIFFDGVMQ